MAHSQPSFHFANARGLSAHLCGCVCVIIHLNVALCVS